MVRSFIIRVLYTLLTLINLKIFRINVLAIKILTLLLGIELCSRRKLGIIRAPRD